MSSVRVLHTSTLHDAPEDTDFRQWIEERDSRIALPETFLAHYHEPLDDYVAESWLPLPQTSQSWGSNTGARNQWSPDGSSIQNTLKPFGFSREEQDDSLYTSSQHNLSSQPPITDPQYEFCRPHSENSVAYQPPVESVIPPYGDAYQFQTPHTTHSQPNYPVYGTASFQTQPTNIHPDLELQHYGLELIQEQPTELWSTLSEATAFLKPEPATKLQPVSKPDRLPLGLILDWSSCDVSSAPTPDSPNSPVLIPKRKSSKESVTKNNPSEAPQLSECVDVFENAPGALASVKRRKKLDPPVRKAAREVRKAGACHQCRFRKRTCSTGTPCSSCLKNGNGLHEIKCQRESPFISRLTHEYFAYSSNRRFMTFDVKIPLASLGLTYETVTIDGIGRVSHTLDLPAWRITLSDFDDGGQSIIMKTEDVKENSSEPQVLLLEDTETLGLQVEQWALEYTSKFVHAAGPKFYATTIAQIMGTVYVKKGLPESSLVAAMLRVASLSFVLRAGVKFTTTGPNPSNRFRTVQAKIDTILYYRLQLAEKDLYQKLQRLIFRSAGCLSREQIYPVALVLWQLLRFCAIATSHLSNIAQKFQTKVSGPADYQHQGLKLVLSTHMALFRSSNPLLLDMTDQLNQNLIGSDAKLIELAMEMRKVVMTLKEKGFPELKGSITYRKEYFDMFRKVYASK